MAALPVRVAEMNFVAAIRAFPVRAAIMTVFDPADIEYHRIRFAGRDSGDCAIFRWVNVLRGLFYLYGDNAQLALAKIVNIVRRQRV